MEERLCQKHELEIKNLSERANEITKRVEKLEDDRKFLYNLDKSIALQNQILLEISEHNKNQDIKMGEYQEIIIKINANLSELATAQRLANEELQALGGRMDSIEEKVIDNENKHKIDIRLSEKKRYEELINKLIAPVGWGALIAGILQLMRTFK